MVGAYYEGHGQQFINFADLDENLFEVPGALQGSTVLGRGAADLPQRSGQGGRRRVLHGQHRLRRLQRLDRHARRCSASPAFDLYITELVNGCVLTKSSAVYGDTSWKLTDRLNLDAGVRWNEDHKTATVYQARLRERRADSTCYRASTSSIRTACRPGSFPIPRRGHRLHRQPCLRERHAAPRLRLSLDRPCDDLRELQPRLQERRLRHARQRGGVPAGPRTATTRRPPTTTRWASSRPARRHAAAQL